MRMCICLVVQEQAWFNNGSCVVSSHDQIKAVYPDGVPEDVAAAFVPIHPDGVPYNFRPTNTRVLINCPDKCME